MEGAEEGIAGVLSDRAASATIPWRQPPGCLVRWKSRRSKWLDRCLCSTSSVGTRVARGPRVITLQKGTRKGQITMQRATCKGCSPGAKYRSLLRGRDSFVAHCSLATDYNKLRYPAL